MPPCFSDSKSYLVWERAWQVELDRRFPKCMSASQLPCMTRMDNAAGLSLTEGAISCTTSSHDQLCNLQQDLLKFASEKCATDFFEEKWRSAGDEVRAKHYFEAMSRACEIPDMEDQRGFAPEVSLKMFQTKDGQGYLDLMRLLMPQRNLPRQYVRIQHPVVDARLGLKAPFETGKPVATNPSMFMRQMMDIRRCLFTTFVVWNILLSFYNLSETVVNVKTSFKSDSKDAFAFANALGHENLSKEQIRAISKETKQLQKEKGVWVCTFCGKFEFQVAEAFKSCGKCKTIGRIVMYCDRYLIGSRDCQVNDWKRGDPPHKSICGKPASSIPATQPPPPESGSTPSMVRTFRRSPALIHQISLLDENSMVDYVLVQPAPLDDYGIAFGSETGSKLFRILRDRAFETGDSGVVHAMYLQLRSTAVRQAGYQVEWLEKQLQVEFGVDVTAVTDEG